MSVVQLRVELPTYARSFTIQVPDTCSVREIKEEISRACPGRPRVEGQKLIWRGRFLTDDESVETIWKVRTHRIHEFFFRLNVPLTTIVSPLMSPVLYIFPCILLHG